MKRFLFSFILLFPVVVHSQIMSLFAGGGVGGDGVPATVSHIDDAVYGRFDRGGNYFVADLNGHKIRKIDTFGIITTIAGNGIMGDSGDGGPATDARLNHPHSVAIDSVGNIFFCEGDGSRVRRIDKTTGIISLVAGNGTLLSGADGGPATSAILLDPLDICFDKYGNLYIAEFGAGKVRKINASGIITTFAGTGASGYSGDGGLANTSNIGGVWGLCADTLGNIYMASTTNSRILKVNTVGIITTIAGNGTGYLYNGDDIPATVANIDPYQITLDDSGNLFIGEFHNYRVRKVDPSGIIHTVAGNGLPGHTGDGGPATAAEFNYPSGIAFDDCGNLYIDETNGMVHKVDLGTSVTPSVSISASAAGTVCAGTPVTFIAAIVNGGTLPAYRWYKNGVVVTGAIGSTYTFAPANGDSVSCMLTSSIHCVTPRTAGSNVLHMVVTPSVTPAISIAASAGTTVCAGTPDTYSATISGGGTSPAYQWYKNGAAVVGATSGTYTYTPADADSIRCVLTSSAVCSAPASISSSSIHMVVNAVIMPSIGISVAPGTAVCAGTGVVLNTTTTGGGASPVYHWYKNGLIIPGATGSTYAYTPANGDVDSCVLTSSNTCAVPATVGSNTIHFVVNPVTVLAISIVAAPGATVCAGTAVVLNTATTGGGVLPAYQWYKNGVAVAGATGSSYTCTPADGDADSCVLTSSAACAVPVAVGSNTIHFVVNPVTIPAISIVAIPGATVCAGVPVSYFSTIASAGSSPAYQWVVDGVLVPGATSATHTYVPSDGDSIRCVLTSSDGCAAPSAISSNSIDMTVHPLVVPSLSIIASPSDTVCTGTPVVFSATASNGGTAPGYEWIKNGAIAGASVATYTYTPANADSVRCILSSNAECATPTTVSSATITMVVDTFIIPTISISGITTAFAGTTVTVTATVAGAGSSYVINWYDDGILFSSTTGPTTTFIKTASLDTITGTIVPTSPGCYDSATSTVFTVVTSDAGVAAITSRSSLFIYPNPAISALTITSTNKITSVAINNLIGQCVYSSYCNSEKVQVDVCTLPTGVYFVKINGSEVRRFVKE